MTDFEFFLLVAAIVDVTIAVFVMYYGAFVLLTFNFVAMTCIFLLQVLRCNSYCVKGKSDTK